MERSKGFYDICVNEVNIEILKETCDVLYDLGYRTIAINQVLEELTPEPKKKKKKGEVRETTDLVPPPLPLAELSKEYEGRLQFINRLTFTLSDQLHAHKLFQCKNLKKYNLLAVIPKTDATLQYACASLDVDLITFNSENKYMLRYHKKTYNQAVERGLFFELMYTPTIWDATARRNIIYMGHLFHAIGKSKNVVISSWAHSPMQVRSPYDVINIGLILGLSESQAKDAITSSCRSLLLHGEGRRCGKAVVNVSRDSVLIEDKVAATSSEMCTEEMDQEDDIESAQKRIKL